MSHLEQNVQRLIGAIKQGCDVRKLNTLVSAIPKNDFLAWRDDSRQDLLHYAVLFENAEAVDYLLKLGYFTLPHEPEVNDYAHLAARLGFTSVLCTILHHRPEDFKVSTRPLFLTREYIQVRRVSNTRRTSCLEIDMPAVVGSNVTGLVAHSTKTNSPNLGSRVSSQSCLLRHDLGTAESSSVSTRAEPSRHVHQYSTPAMMKRRNSSPESSRLGLHEHVVNKVSQFSVSKVSSPNCNPLDLAAIYKQVNCVKTLLNMFVMRSHPEITGKGYMTMAAKAANKASLKLLMEPYSGGTNDQSVREDYRSAVQECVQNVYGECLEVLLDRELIDHKLVFKHINYFHIMYSQPLSTNHALAALERMPGMTDILISRGHDVKVTMPPRTYALYSLLDNTLSLSDFSLSDYIMHCIKTLLRNGADPNFDEVDFEKNLQPSYRGGRGLGGRLPYSSALHCLIQSLQRYHPTHKGQATRFVQECVSVLISFNANIELVGSIDVDNECLRGDVLWQFAWSSVHMGLERGLFHCLMRYGAQPQRMYDGQFALNVYLDTLCDLLKRDPDHALEHLAKREKDVEQMISLLCSYMAPWHVRGVWDVFNYKHKKCSGDAHVRFKRHVNDALTAESRNVHTLRKMAAWQVWKLSHRQAENVMKLPIAKDLKTQVLPLVLFQTLW